MTNVSEVAAFLGLEYFGTDFAIDKVCSVNFPQGGALSFIKKHRSEELSSLPVLWLVMAKPRTPLSFLGAYIVTPNPRLAYARVIQHFFVPKNETSKIAESARIGKSVSLGQGVFIGEGTVVGDNVQIGDDTIINHNVVIAANTVIGKNCYIKSGAVIGEDGFGFEYDENNHPIKLPHLGKVIIGSHVEIGAKSTIARGTIENTIIGNHIKIDDQVHIAHNCQIGENTIITACAEISGSVKVGKNCWFGPNSSIIQKVKIEDGVTVGIGTTITEDLAKKTVRMSLPGMPLKLMLKLQKMVCHE